MARRPPRCIPPIHDSERTLLHRIASEPLPRVLTGDENLLVVCALFQAGHVDAAMRVVVDPLGGGPQVGVVVTEITPSGWLLLRRSKS